MTLYMCWLWDTSSSGYTIATLLYSSSWWRKALPLLVKGSSWPLSERCTMMVPAEHPQKMHYNASVLNRYHCITGFWTHWYKAVTVSSTYQLSVINSYQCITRSISCQQLSAITYYQLSLIISMSVISYQLSKIKRTLQQDVPPCTGLPSPNTVIQRWCNSENCPSHSHLERPRPTGSCWHRLLISLTPQPKR